MINRPVLIVTLGYLIGIIIGLYCKISIAFFIIPLITLIIVLKNKMNSRIKHYYSIFCIKKILIIISISALISNTIVLLLNNSYDNKYKNIGEANFIATIVSGPKEKNYSTQYKIRVESINGNEKYKNTYLYINVKEAININYGDRIKFLGKFIEPDVQRNYGGFNYKDYLKSIGLYGTVKTNYVEVIGKGNINILKLLANHVSDYIKNTISSNIDNKNNKDLLLGIMLGNDDELEDSIKENFQNSSLAHILAVSGMHVSFIILGITILISNLKLHKKIIKIVTILLLIFFIFLTNESPSVIRACIMAIMSSISIFLYRKNDIITNICIALLILLLQNPFSIMNIGLILSFLATIGIILFYKLILRILNRNKNEDKGNSNTVIIRKLIVKIKEIISVSLAAQILIFPLSIIYFNKISLTFLISNILVSSIIGIIIILGFISILIPFKFIFNILNLLLEILKQIASIFANIPISKITVVTPNIIYVICYYIIIFILYYVVHLRSKEYKRRIEKQILIFMDSFKKIILNNKKYVIISVLILFIIIHLINIVPKDLKVYFIDVSQGDASLIITPKNKTILIDGGGNKDYDIRKKYFTSILIRQESIKFRLYNNISF